LKSQSNRYAMRMSGTSKAHDMKTTIWASCPKCKTELKIDTDETELVQIECPDCNKLFAAKVPPRSAAPVHEVFSQMPVLPPFQPAQVHYQSRRKSDDSMNPAVLTALIVVCASAILIPLGFGGYYLYSRHREVSQVAMNDSAKSNAAKNSNSSAQQSFSTSAPTESTTPVFRDFSSQTQAGRKVPPSNDSASGAATAQPQPDAPAFAAPELNPPKLVQSEPSAAQTTQTPNSAPTTAGPMTSGSMTSGTSNPSQVQVSVSGAGTSQSGLSIPLQRFVGPSGVFIFILHSKGHSVGNAVQELQRNLSIPEVHTEGGSDHTTIGIRYSGPVDSVVKGIRFGNVSYVDEESRSIHVKVN
jgi:DNA-directed RNA polymerase subunit RPC12/RpoP